MFFLACAFMAGYYFYMTSRGTIICISDNMLRYGKAAEIVLEGIEGVVVWGYIVTSLPLAYLLYRESDLKKIERFVLVIFILLSSMSLLFSVIAVYVKTN
jgi:hypothetical protein